MGFDAGHRIAALDVGSNTIRALAVTVEPGGVLRVYADDFAMTALGRGLAETGLMPEDAIEHTVDFASAFLRQNEPIGTTCAVGTAAARDANNSGHLISALHDRCGIELEVLSGEEEARLTYLGAASALGGMGDESVLVADIGGRSMELATAPHPGGAIEGLSLPLGARALTEAYLIDDPPSTAQISAARAHIAEILIQARDLLATGEIFVAAGGTACSAALLANNTWDLDLRSIALLRRELCAMPLEARRERLAFDPPRAEVICAGLVVLEYYVSRAPDRRIRISLGGIREGLLIAKTGAQTIRRPEDLI